MQFRMFSKFKKMPLLHIIVFLYHFRCLFWSLDTLLIFITLLAIGLAILLIYMQKA